MRPCRTHLMMSPSAPEVDCSLSKHPKFKQSTQWSAPREGLPSRVFHTQLGQECVKG